MDNVPRLSLVSIGKNRSKALRPREAAGGMELYEKRLLSHAADDVARLASRVVKIDSTRSRALEPSLHIFDINPEMRMFLDIGV